MFAPFSIQIVSKIYYFGMLRQLFRVQWLYIPSGIENTWKSLKPQCQSANFLPPPNRSAFLCAKNILSLTYPTLVHFFTIYFLFFRVLGKQPNTDVYRTYWLFLKILSIWHSVTFNLIILSVLLVLSVAFGTDYLFSLEILSSLLPTYCASFYSPVVESFLSVSCLPSLGCPHVSQIYLCYLFA